MNTLTFQLYLLSSMRAVSNVETALGMLGASRLHAAQAAESARRLGFQEPGHPARLYVDALGPPRQEEPDLSVGVGSVLAGSTALLFRLPLWPAFDFVVRRHPTGYAWGMGFQRASGTH